MRKRVFTGQVRISTVEIERTGKNLFPFLFKDTEIRDKRRDKR